MGTFMNPYLTFLKQAVVNNALLRGEFTLKSGKKSDYYIDLRKV